MAMISGATGPYGSYSLVNKISVKWAGEKSASPKPWLFIRQIPIFLNPLMAVFGTAVCI